MWLSQKIGGHSAKLAEFLASIGMLGMLALAFGTVADVLGRYFFAHPIRGFIDVATMGGAVLLAASMPYVLITRGNIVIDVLGRSLGLRASRLLDSFGALVTAIFFSVMAWQYWRYAVELRETGEVLPILRLPIWPWWTAVAILIVISAFIGVVAVFAPKRSA